MWDVKQKIRQLLDSTGTTTGQLAAQLRERGDTTVQGSQIRRALLDERTPSPLWTRRLLTCLEILTEIQERQNSEIKAALKRADKALSQAV
ncbi:MAG: hypothetical protein J6D54_04650 [Olsenella sp.]|nr:hypothetical protein [Olsenella sp.]